MVNGVVIYPSLPNEMMFRPAEEVCAFIASDRETHLQAYDIKENSDYVMATCMHLSEGSVGDTVTIFDDIRNAKTYKMVFGDYGDAEEETRPEYNLLASILHHEGRKVWGRVIVMCCCADDKLVPCTPEDVLRILYRRAWHHGVCFHETGGVPEQVEVDNRWIVRGKDGLCISEWGKAFYRDPKGRQLLKVSRGDEYFVFATVEGSVLVDLFVEDFTGFAVDA